MKTERKTMFQFAVTIKSHTIMIIIIAIFVQQNIFYSRFTSGEGSTNDKKNKRKMIM